MLSDRYSGKKYDVLCYFGGRRKQTFYERIFLGEEQGQIFILDCIVSLSVIAEKYKHGQQSIPLLGPC